MLRARRTSALACLAALLAVLTPTSASGAARTPSGESPVVRTTAGPVRGQNTAEGRQFLGIPYAADPVGALRWRPPQPHPLWEGVREATAFGPRCLQGTNSQQGTYTENCLNLNVYTPTSPRRLPVMVWIHGGGMIQGGGRDYVADRFAADGNVIVVTINYRLGASGFLTLPGAQSNYGLLDQQAALRWVRANIARFGGDPHAVTIAGESSGGRAVCSQLASPTARGLFRAAISQSASYRDCAAIPVKNAETTGRAFADALGCADTDSQAVLDCLRTKTPQEVLAAQSGRAWGPIVGDRVLPQQPAETFAAGRQAKVPVLFGTTRTEGRYFDYFDFDGKGQPLTSEQYPQTMRGWFGEDIADEVLARYPLTDYPTPTLAHAAARGDRDYSCPTARVSRQLAQGAPVYQYEFADVTGPPAENLRNLNTDYDFGATHTNDLQYLFRHHGREAPFNAEERQLSRQMIQYWSSFVSHGVPRASGLPDMTDQRVRPGEVTVLQTSSAGGPRPSADFTAAHHCALWDAAAATG
ncbi:carboxylesterase/lipase family protein [Streptomyces sp. MA5143a]|uniref:carboxylesterase/lipase family protein n=1 Tax=Streptomyces sp. MA5143a TaxID=2083010 RepID=UPI000D1A6751|nr:carboxylesterase family protein [Streptomyces sp. MA5143a]SPF04388.1 Para-nitrobenzyl esterase [Streptomyces sp. MA5143a]